MDESVFRREAYSMLRKMGYWPIRGRDATICPKCHGKILPPIGRPDLIILAPTGINRVLETKYLSQRETAFQFAIVTEEQRRWLGEWLKQGGLGYLGIGVQTRPASFYIIDWGAWLAIEDAVRPFQASIPVDLTKGRNYLLSLKERKLDLVTQAARFKLTRRGGEWQLPSGHSLLSWRVVDYGSD